jgi:hypothetical protein
MTDAAATPQCPHCGETLRPFQLPDNTGWDSPIHFACFNDECPYFRRGWSWMFDHYGVKSSYRHRVDPVSGTSSPLPVWSKDAIKDRILDAEIIAGTSDDDLSPEKPRGRAPGTGHREAAARPTTRTGRTTPVKNVAGPAKQKREAVRKPARKGKET